MSPEADQDLNSTPQLFSGQHSNCLHHIGCASVAVLPQRETSTHGFATLGSAVSPGPALEHEDAQHEKDNSRVQHLVAAPVSMQSCS